MRGNLIVGIVGAVVGTLIVAAGAWLALDTVANAYARERAQIIVEQLNSGGREIAYDSVSVDTLSQQVSMTGLVIRQDGEEAARIGRLTVAGYDWQNPRQPRFMDIRLRGLNPSTRDADPAQQALMTAMGINRLNARMAYRHDPQTQVLTLENLSVGVPGSASLRAEARFGNVAAIGFEDVGAAQAALLQATFIGAEIVYEDGGLTRRLIDTLSQAETVDAAQARQGLIAQAQEARDEAEDPFARKLFETIAEFLANENAERIRITARPENPVPYTEIGSIASDFDALSARLNLAFTTE
jgi:hypothetical protein